MNKFKTYGQFLNESNQNNIVNIILEALEPTIVEMVAATEKWFVETFKQEFTKYDRESARINLIYDMVKSIESYTMPTDSLITLNVRKSAKGNIEISSQIQREGIAYIFSTEAIYAGGHNIQRLHYRYIVKTDLPKTGATEITKEYSEKIKKMSKLEKLNKEIQDYELRLKRTVEDFESNSKLTDTEIIKTIKDNSKESWYEWPSWEEIIKRDAAKNYNNSEEYYNQQMQDGIARRIVSWKSMNIDSKKRYAADYQKTIKKLQTKLDSML
jgi:hypothetical protein